MELKNQILKIADVAQRNGHVYTQDALEKAVDNAQERIKNQDGILGVLGEPRNEGSIDIAEISHAITNIRMDGDKMVADFKILSTPKGNILRQLLEAGITPQFSVSGFGTVAEDGTVSDFELVTVYAKYHA